MDDIDLVKFEYDAAVERCLAEWQITLFEAKHYPAQPIVPRWLGVWPDYKKRKVVVEVKFFRGRRMTFNLPLRLALEVYDKLGDAIRHLIAARHPPHVPPPDVPPPGMSLH